MNIKDLEKLSKDIKKGKIHKLTPSSKFKFQCNLCGKCCLQTSVLINSYDMVRLRQGLRLNTGEIFNKKYITFTIGPNSGLPVLSLNYHRFGRCPFLTPSIDGKKAFARFYKRKIKDVTLKDISKFKKFLRENPKKARKILEGLKIEQWTCAVHKHRPLVCRFYPVGRITKMSKKGEMLKQTWLLQDTKQDKEFCPGFKGKKEWTLKKFLENIEFENYDKGSNIQKEIISLLIDNKLTAKYLEEDSVILNILGNIMFNFDSFNFCSKDLTAVKTIYNPKATQKDFMYVTDKIKEAVKTVCKTYKKLGKDELERKMIAEREKWNL